MTGDGSASYDFTGDVVLITGGAGGLGRDIALSFARSGAKVAVSDLGDRTKEAVPYATGSESDLAATAADARRSAPSDRRPRDVTDEAEVEAMIAAVIERFGRLDIMVSNAGVISGGRVWELTEAQWDSVVDVDLKGPFLCSKHAARHMIDRDGPGRLIITISSTSGLVGIPGQVTLPVGQARGRRPGENAGAGARALRRDRQRDLPDRRSTRRCSTT